MGTRGAGRMVVTLAALAVMASAVGCGDDDEVETETPAPTTLSDEGSGGDTLTAEPSQEELDAAYVGLTLDEATAAAEEAGVPSRVVREDGEDLAVTMDYVPERVNFEVEDGVVTAVSAG